MASLMRVFSPSCTFAVAALLAAAAPATAQESAEKFYKGKTVQAVVGYRGRARPSSSICAC